MKRIYTLIALVIMIAVIVGVPYLLWVILAWTFSQKSQVAVAIIAAAATVLAGLGAVALSQQRTKTREIAESHRPQKIDLYTRLIKKVMEVIHKHKDDKSEDALVKDTELEQFFQDFTTDLVLWGSPSVVRAYSKSRDASKKASSPSSIVLMDDVIRAMRRDLGHSDWLLQRGELIKTFLRDPEELDRLL